MWEIEDAVEARVGYRGKDLPWRLRCWAGRPELGLWIGRDATPARPLAWLVPPIDAVADHPPRLEEPPLFPSLAEFYFRQADVVANLPQSDGFAFGVVLTHRVVHADNDCLAVESIVAISTSLLDSHPTVDLRASSPRPLAAEDLERLPNPHAVLPPLGRTDAGIPAPIFRLGQPTAIGQPVLMLPPSDRAAAQQFEGPGDALRVRLLAEFLEKGVIRKARYWTSCWAETPSDADLVALYQTLLNAPLPLTP